MPTSDVAAAGLALVTPDGHALFLRRGAHCDHPGEWCFPGGVIEGEETPEEAAVREAREETGFIADDDAERPQVARHLFNGAEGTPRINFTTFRQRVGNPFIPTLDAEHEGWAWAPLDAPPEPLHPGLAAVLPRLKTGMAGDALAYDRTSVRTIDRDGRLHVEVTNISKANICPYVGKEIPEYEQLGLDPRKVYKLLRHPKELARAVPSFNNQPVLSEHVPVTAADYDEKVKKFTIGSTGTNATFEAPYLKNSLVIWSGKAIKGIESDEQKQISSGYHYRADMTPGTYEGEAYDGVMRDIHGNHVAVVEEGRAGPDVVVGDSKENLKMAAQSPTRFAAILLSTVAGGMSPILAKDAKLDIKPFKGLTPKNFAERRPAIEAAIQKAVKGRMAKDAKPEHLMELLDAFEQAEGEGFDEPVSEAQRKAMFAAASGNSNLGIPKAVGEEFVGKSHDEGNMENHEPKPEQPTVDEGPMRDFLKGKGMDDASIEEAVKLMHPPKAEDAEEEPSEEEEEKKGPPFTEKKEGEDEPPPFNGKPKPGGAQDTVTKAAMDAALKKAADDTRKATMAQMRAVRDAEIKVEPVVGKLAIAHDSAADVFKTALGILGVKDAQLAKVPPEGYEAMFDIAPKPTRSREAPTIATDAAATQSFHKRFPGTENIRFA